jgi:hypothetical protein
MAKQKKTDERALQLTLDGRTYVMRLNDFTGADDLAIYQATGFTVFQVFGGDALTLFTVAALLWRHRVRHGEPQLTFDAVNGALSFDALETVTTEIDEKAAPEA